MSKTKQSSGDKAEVDVRLIDQWLVEHYRTPEDILGKEFCFLRLTFSQ